MNLKNIFKRKTQTEAELKQARLKGNKSNFFSSLIVATVAVGVVGYTLKPDMLTNDNAAMLKAIDTHIEKEQAEKQAEKDNAARRDFYIETLKNKGLNRQQIKINIMQLSDEQKKAKGFPVKEVKESYEDKIIKLKERQQRDKEVINNLNVSVNKTKRRSPSFS